MKATEYEVRKALAEQYEKKFGHKPNFGACMIIAACAPLVMEDGNAYVWKGEGSMRTLEKIEP